MKIITILVLIAALVLSFFSWQVFKSTKILDKRISKTRSSIFVIKDEAKSLSGYKEEKGQVLADFYLEVFNNIKEYCFYHNLPSEIKISGSKDNVNIKEYFKESRYRGINCVDILCRVDFNDPQKFYLLGLFQKMAKDRPLEILDVKIEKTSANLTIRLYGL